MPLHQVINFNSYTKILIWKITESLEDLSGSVILADTSFFRLSNMKSVQHKCGFLSVRKLLQEAGYSDLDLFYDAFGKPHLKDGKHISISHSHDFSAIIISDEIVGIDLELRRVKILDIADRFNDNSHLDKTDTEKFIREITISWGVKEAIFKIRNEPGISFKSHIIVAPFTLEKKLGRARLQFAEVEKDFEFHFEEIEDYTLVYAFEKN